MSEGVLLSPPLQDRSRDTLERIVGAARELARAVAAEADFERPTIVCTGGATPFLAAAFAELDAREPSPATSDQSVF